MKVGVTLFILAFSLVVQAAKEIPAGHSISADCQEFINSIQVKYEYDWVKSKAVPGRADSADIYVFYYYMKTTLVNGRLKNPIAFFNGGPGFDSHGQAQQMEIARIKHQIKTELNFVYIDQRGTGCSSPYPRGRSFEVLEALKSFGSRGIVYDAEVIRQKLVGSRPWKIFGQSFGAYIVYRYLSLFPQSISKAYAHGNAVGVLDEDRSYYRILSQHTVTESYLKAYPDDRSRLVLLKAALANKANCLHNTRQYYCGYEMMNPLVYSLGYKSNWENIHRWLQIIAPSGGVVMAGLQDYVSNFITGPVTLYRWTEDPLEMKNVMNVSLNFFGLFDWSSRPLTASMCRRVNELIFKNTGVSADQLLLNECYAPLQYNYEDQIEPLIRAEVPDLASDFISPEQVLKQITKYKITVFAYSGALDCYVPQAAFAVQNKIFGSKVKYTHFADSGHDGYLQERQVFVDFTK